MEKHYEINTHLARVASDIHTEFAAKSHGERPFGRT